MESNYKVCRNEACSRFNVLVIRDDDKCSVCTSQLERYDHSHSGEGGFDTPPLFDMNTGDNNRQKAPTVIRALPAKPTQEREDDTFTCDPDVKGCPVVVSPTIYIPLSLFNTWCFLAREFEVEWIAWQKGGPVKDGEGLMLTPDGIYFPKQVCNGAHVEVEDGECPPPGTIAAIHSHVGMNAFFSGEDENHFNHQIELVINNRGQLLSSVRVTLECGRFSRTTGKIVLTGCGNDMKLADLLRKQMKEQQHSAVWIGGAE